MLKIKQVREHKKLTQDKISELTGIPKRTYISYEAETTDIPLKKLLNIATSLGVSICDLIEDKEQGTKSNHVQVANGNNNQQTITQVRHDNELLLERIKSLERENELLNQMVELLKQK